MNFLYPAGLFFAAIIPLIILMYLLKLKRRRVVLPSILLWKRSLRDLMANVPFQKLRRNILLILQLIIAAFLILALARPTFFMTKASGRSLVVLIDTSASMAVRENGGKTRLDLAKEEVKRLFTQMRPRDQMTLVSFNSLTRIEQTSTNDKSRLKLKLKSLLTSDLRTDLNDALLILSSVYKNTPNLEAYLISDGVFGNYSSFNAELPDITFIRIGDTNRNVGITAIDVRRDIESLNQYQIFVSIENASNQIMKTITGLYEAQNPLDVKEITLDPSEKKAVMFSITGDVERRLEVVLDNDDALQKDNRAFCVVPAPEKAKVLLVTEGNYFLENMLQADRNIDAITVKPDDYEFKPLQDIIIFDNFAPDSLPPQNSIFINAFSSSELLRLGEKIEYPFVIDWDETHPLVRFANFENLTIQQARNMTLSRQAKVLLESDETPLIALVERDQMKALVVGFDIFDSDWPLRPSFPVVMANAIRHLSGKYEVSLERLRRTGETFPVLKPENEQVQVKVKTPDGSIQTLEFFMRDVLYFADTDTAGFYEVSEENKTVKVMAVNIASSRESDISPRNNINIGGKELLAQIEIQKSTLEIWKPLLLITLLFLVIEWLVYTKRMWT